MTDIKQAGIDAKEIERQVLEVVNLLSAEWENKYPDLNIGISCSRRSSFLEQDKKGHVVSTWVTVK